MNSDLNTRPLEPGEADQLRDLYLRAPGYFRQLGGHVPTLSDVERDLDTVLRDPNRRLEFLYDSGGQLVGSLDYKLAYPGPGDLTINLLLIREDRQGAGLGASAVRLLEARYAGQVRRVLAGVLGENQRGAQFWHRLGYHFHRDARPVMSWYARSLGHGRPGVSWRGPGRPKEGRAERSGV